MSPPTRPSRTGVRGGAVACALVIGLLTACSSSGASTGSAAAGSTGAPPAAASSAAAGSPSPEAGSTVPAATSAAAVAPSPAVTAMAVTASDFSFRLDTTDVAAGNYTVTLTNQGRATHDLVVEKDGSDVARSDRIGPGSSTTFTVTLQPGRYVFYCSVANHRAMGMETDVTVS